MTSSLYLKELLGTVPLGLIILSALMVIWAGCGSDSSTGDEPVVHLVYQDWRSDWLASLAAEHHIRVLYNPDPLTPISSTMLTEMQNGTAPDVFQGCCSFFPAWAQAGFALDLRPYVEADLDQATISDWDPAQYGSLFTSEGLQFGLSKYHGALALYYNKDIFDEYGVDYPDDNWSHDEYLIAMKLLTRDRDGDGDGDGLTDLWGSMIDISWDRVQMHINGWGGHMVDPEDPTRCLMGEPESVAATVTVVHWATGHLMREGEEIRLLPVMAEEFNKAGHRNEADKRIVVEVHNVPSELQAEYLVTRVKSDTRIDLHGMTDGYVDRNTSDSDPAIVTPSSAHWLVSANYDIRTDPNGPLVDLGAAKSIVSPVIGIVTHEEMARCLGWPDKEIGYADIMALRNSPEGWTQYPCAKSAWGETPLVAFTDPTTSSTGRSLHLALYSFASGKRPEDLILKDVNNPEVVSYVERFQGLIDHYLIGTTVLNTKIYQGPGYGHFFVMPEDNLIHLYEGTESAFINGKKVRPGPIAERGLRMVMIYPKEGSMPRSNCACVVQAEWVSGEQAEAAQEWIGFIREDEQQRSFMAAGFRPGTDISLTDPSSKINARYGLDPTKPATPTDSLNPSLIDPAVAAAIDESWEFVKRPAIVTLVVDTSGSMMGDKLKQAKEGAIRFVDSMATNNQVGLVTFGDTIKTQIPVAPLIDNRFKIAAAAQEMRARGETALYDAIKAGIELTDAAEGDEDAIRAVIVLTDGRANQCSTHLDDIIHMEANEKRILKYSGCESDPAVVNQDGRSVDKKDVVGTGLAIKTNEHHDIQIFFIGIGEDADMDVGRVLAQATGAEFQGVAEDDLANLLAEFSGYF